VRVNESSEAAIRAASELIGGDHLQSRSFSVEAFIEQTEEEGTPEHARSVMAMMLAACATVRILRTPYEGISELTPHAARLARDLIDTMPHPPTWSIDAIDRSSGLKEGAPYSSDERTGVLRQTEVIAERTHLRMKEVDANPAEVEDLLLRAVSPSLYADFAFLLCLNFRSVATRLTPGAFEELLAKYVADSLKYGSE